MHITKFVIAFSVGMLMPLSAFCAVSCVQDKVSKAYEGKSGPTAECDKPAPLMAGGLTREIRLSAQGGVPLGPVSQQWIIAKDQPIHAALEAWARTASWVLIWYPGFSWKAIAPVNMSHHKDVVAAVADVVSILRDEGKPLQLRVSDGNQVMEILSTEVKND